MDQKDLQIFIMTLNKNIFTFYIMTILGTEQYHDFPLVITSGRDSMDVRINIVP